MIRKFFSTKLKNNYNSPINAIRNRNSFTAPIFQKYPCLLSSQVMNKLITASRTSQNYTFFLLFADKEKNSSDKALQSTEINEEKITAKYTKKIESADLNSALKAAEANRRKFSAY